MLERPALEQLHGHERPPLEFSDIVDRADVRMIECRCGARFAPESLGRLRVVGDVVRQELQRNVSAQARVLGFVDNAHASAAQFFQDSVVGNRAADNGGSIRHRPCIVRQRLNTGKSRNISLLIWDVLYSLQEGFFTACGLLSDRA